MQRRTFISTLAAAGAFAAFKPTPAQQKPKFDLDVLLAVTEVPAIAVAGIIDGRPIQRFAGVRSVTDKVPVTADTYFPAASLSKPVFAWAVRDLVRQGKLEWSKPLQDYTDLGLTGDARRITAEHVLTHSTGLANWRFQPNEELKSNFAPGSRWQYSGEGIFLLQRVVEKIVGVPIATYMKQSVLSPFGMAASTYAWTPELQAKAAFGHDRHGALLERSSVFYDQRNHDRLQKAGLQPESATYAQIVAAYEKAKAPPLPVAMSPNMAGSLWTTATDYPKFLQRVLADIPQRPDEYRARVDVNPQIAWTLGWGVDRSLRGDRSARRDRSFHGDRSPRRDQLLHGDRSLVPPALFHWGDGPGFKNFAWVQPERKTALAFFTNGDHGQQTYSSAFRHLLGEDPASLDWI